MNGDILITGASGFIGREAVRAARAQGSLVYAMVRRAASIPQEWQADKTIIPVVCDLARDDIDLPNVKTVLHTAAALTGDEATHLRDTDSATRALIAAIEAQSNPPHLVLLSSIAVYDTLSLPENATLDEATNIEPDPAGRDAYCRAKLAQEAIALMAAEAGGFALTILRAGAVFGPGRLWNGHIGVGIGPLLLRFGGGGQVPVCSVAHCAAALVSAANLPPDTGAIDIVNVLDDDLPDRARFVKALQGAGCPKWVLPLPWQMLDILAKALALVPVLRSRLPGLLRSPIIHARLKPLKYSTERLHEKYSLKSKLGFEAAMHRALDAQSQHPRGD